MSIPANGSAATPVLVPLDRIPTDERTQTRVRVRSGVVRDYAAAMKKQLSEGGLCFPPIILFHDGQDYWLGDGFHRVLAAREAGLTEMAAEVRLGSQRDALLFAISANIGHGLGRTTPDKRKAVALLLADAEWSQWSDREIGRRCQVGNALVSRMRRSASVSGTQMQTRKVHRAGRVYEMKPAGGEGAEPDLAAPTPEAPADAVHRADALGLPLPEARANAFTAAADFQEARELLDRLARVVDRIARGPAGERYRRELVWKTKEGPGHFACPVLAACGSKLLGAEPYCGYCPNCHADSPARGHRDCKTCGGLGWTTRAAFEACRASDQERIRRLRTGKSSN
jgi:hypothetical protein